MRLLIIADTHIPKRARALPERLWSEVDSADLVVHAGDWADVALLDQLEQRATVLGVYGNNDGADLRARLPEVARAELAGVRVAVVHETGQTQGRESRAMQRFPDTDLLIFGHSHIPWDSVAPNGMRLLNPGSPTDRRRQPVHTYLVAELSDGQVDVTLHEL